MGGSYKKEPSTNPIRDMSLVVKWRDKHEEGEQIRVMFNLRLMVPTQSAPSLLLLLSYPFILWSHTPL